MNDRMFFFSRAILLLACIIIALNIYISCAANETKNESKNMISDYYKAIEHAASPRISIKYCKKILEMEPKNAKAHFILATAYEDMANIVIQDSKDKKKYIKLSEKHYKIAKDLGYIDDKQEDREDNLTP